MTRNKEGLSGIRQIRVADPSMTCECLSMDYPIGTVMAWSEKPEFIAVKYPSHMVVYEVVKCLKTETIDNGFSEVSTLEVRAVLSYLIGPES